MVKMNGKHQRKWIIILLSLIVLGSFCVSALPVVEYTSPTRRSGSFTSDHWVAVNASISSAGLQSFQFNWNGTPYPIYDPSLVLGLNLNNNSLIGEDKYTTVDMSPYGATGRNWGVRRTTGKYSGAMSFDGDNDKVSFDSSPALSVNGPITVSAWVKDQDNSRAESIVSKGSYSLKVGPDEKPFFEMITGSDTLDFIATLGGSVQALAVYNGTLYAGAGEVYRYLGEGNWSDTGDVGTNEITYTLAVYDGSLYAGTYPGVVYRYDGGNVWTSVGKPGDTTQVTSLAVYKGGLYGATASGKVYRYNGGSSWTDMGSLGQSERIMALAVYDGKLYAGADGPEKHHGANCGRVYRFDGVNNWTEVGMLGGYGGVVTLAVFDGNLYAGTDYPGTISRFDGWNGTNYTWTRVGQIPGCDIYSLAVYNGRLYCGTGYVSTNLYRYEGGSNWTKVTTIYNNNVISEAVYDGKLFFGSMGGNTYSFGEGIAVYSDTAISDQFTHIAASYDGQTARIYIDGSEQGSRDGSVAIGSTDAPLLIGTAAGSAVGGFTSTGEESFYGVLDEIRIYNRSLFSDEIRMQYLSNYQRYSASSWGFYVNQTDLANGTYSYSCLAQDAGGSTQSQTRTITIGQMPAGCQMPGNVEPCDSISLQEVVGMINSWAEGNASLGDVISLINSWADPENNPPM